MGINKTKDLMSRAQEAIISAAQSDVEAAYDEIFSENNNGRLSEDIFRERFLPFFSGKIKDDQKLGITTAWIAIAGSITSRVDIVDGSDNVLFTVPALTSSDFVGADGLTKRPSFNSLVDRAREKAFRLPQLGQVVLGNEGTALVNSMVAKPNEKDESAWNDIFTRYNLPLPNKSKAKVTEQKKQEDDDILYE